MNQAENMKMISHYHQQMVSNWYLTWARWFYVPKGHPKGRALTSSTTIGNAIGVTAVCGEFSFFFGWHHERSSDWLFGRSFCLLFTVETNETGIELRYLGSKHTWLVRRKRRLKRPILDILFCLFCVPKIIDPFQETQSTWDSNPSDTLKRGEYPESVLIQASPIWMQFRLLKGEGWCTMCKYTNVSSIHITHRE